MGCVPDVGSNQGEQQLWVGRGDAGEVSSIPHPVCTGTEGQGGGSLWEPCWAHYVHYAGPSRAGVTGRLAPRGPGVQGRCRKHSSELLQGVRITMSCLPFHLHLVPPGISIPGNTPGWAPHRDSALVTLRTWSKSLASFIRSVPRQGRCVPTLPSGGARTSLRRQLRQPAAHRGPGSCLLPQRGRGSGGFRGGNLQGGGGGPQRAGCRSGWGGQASGSGGLWGALHPWRRTHKRTGTDVHFKSCLAVWGSIGPLLHFGGQEALPNRLGCSQEPPTLSSGFSNGSLQEGGAFQPESWGTLAPPRGPQRGFPGDSVWARRPLLAAPGAGVSLPACCVGTAVSQPPFVHAPWAASHSEPGAVRGVRGPPGGMWPPGPQVPAKLRTPRPRWAAGGRLQWGADCLHTGRAEAFY